MDDGEDSDVRRASVMAYFRHHYPNARESTIERKTDELIAELDRLSNKPSA